VAAVVLGSVTPPQADITKLEVTLGCTTEVSTFELWLQNWDKKYSPSGTYPLILGSDGSISLGRGANCPPLITLRMEKVTFPSTPNEHYAYISGRCWGEKLFRKRVTTKYVSKKGEFIVKDLIDNYVGLGHVRSAVELIEDTSTTYNLLKYNDTPVWDILQYIASTADLGGVIGYDFRVAPDGLFEFFPLNSKTSPVSLTDVIESSEYGGDIFRKKNKITIYGTADKPNESTRDLATEMVTPYIGSEVDQVSAAGQKNLYVGSTVGFAIGMRIAIMQGPYYEINEVAGGVLNDYLIMTENLAHTYNVAAGVFRVPGWGPQNSTISAESTIKVVGSRSVKVATPIDAGEFGAMYVNEILVDAELYPEIRFKLYATRASSGYVRVWDSAWKTAMTTFSQVVADGRFHHQVINAGSASEEAWQVESGFDWTLIRITEVGLNNPGLTDPATTCYVDGLYWSGRRYSYTKQAPSGDLREFVDTDQELASDYECQLRAEAMYDYYSGPAVSSPIGSTVIDYGTTPILPGDKIHVVLPNENVSADFRIESGVKYAYDGRTTELSIDFVVGRQPRLYADYMYRLSSKQDYLVRHSMGSLGRVGGLSPR
jgi:hypothetical protein